MGLGLTENFRMAAGGNKMLFITVTHDGATTSFEAASIDLSYIEHIDRSFPFIGSLVADLSVLVCNGHASMDAAHATVTFKSVPIAGATQNLIVVGW